MEEENWLPQVFLSHPYMCHDICVNVYTYINDKLINMIQLKKEVPEVERKGYYK